MEVCRAARPRSTTPPASRQRNTIRVVTFYESHISLYEYRARLLFLFSCCYSRHGPLFLLATYSPAMHPDTNGCGRRSRTRYLSSISLLSASGRNHEFEKRWTSHTKYFSLCSEPRGTSSIRLQHLCLCLLSLVAWPSLQNGHLSHSPFSYVSLL